MIEAFVFGLEVCALYIWLSARGICLKAEENPNVLGNQFLVVAGLSSISLARRDDDENGIFFDAMTKGG